MTVNGEAATSGYQTSYTVDLDLPLGLNELTIVAVTAASESKTSKWKYDVVPEDEFLYDENGNLADDGTRTYEWDAEDRLVAVEETGTGKRSEFAYDGLSRRVKIVEKTSGSTDSDRRYVWDGLSIAECRMSDGETVEKRYFWEGFKEGSDAYCYTRDHLGSIEGLIDASGVVRGRWEYGPWGERSANFVTSGAVEVDFGYTGYWNHARSGLALAPYRAYSSTYKRWISRDPIAENGGINLYNYCNNNPINKIDPDGLLTTRPTMDPGQGGGGAGPISTQYQRNYPLQINNPIQGMQRFLFGGGAPVELGPGLTNSLKNLQKNATFPRNSFPTVRCQEQPTNLATGDYWDWNNLADSLNVGLTLGEFRYLNDGKTTTITDTYGFPFSQSDHMGGTAYHNAPLSIIPGKIGTPYNSSGSYPTP